MYEKSLRTSTQKRIFCRMDYRRPIRALQATPHSELEKVRKATGLGIQTLRQIKYGVTPNPRVDTLEKLAAYFRL